MKQKLLFLVLVFLLVFKVYSQEINSPPPPCGYTPVYVCDENGDGLEVVNLYDLFPFSFCYINELESENYYPLTYYFTEEDVINGTNPIPTPDAFMASMGMVEQYIFRRADPIDPTSNGILMASDPLAIFIPPTPNSPSPLYSCATSSNGFAVFDLNSKRDEIRSSQNYNYEIRFFESLSDAQNLNNPISNIYNNVVPYQQTVFASMSLPHTGQSLQDICIEIVPLDLIVGECEDISVNLLPGPTNPRPGFDYLNTLFIQNLGSNSATGSVEFIHDASVLFLNAVSSNPNYVITTTSNGFVVDFMDLEAGGSEYVNISLFCPPSVPLGTLITNNALIINNNDNHPANDTSVLSEIVIGSYDPNDKMESHGPTIYIDDFTSEDYLYYTIRFQNVGTADAINIKIEDVLDDQLDESTFQMIRASHNYTLSRVGNNLEWNFNGIHLPSEDMDEENSHGFVYFKIKPHSGYAIGDVIPNNAAIYFDVNPAIITNTFETEFEQTLGMSNDPKDYFYIYPNPASNLLTIRNEMGSGNVTIKILDIQGKHILSKQSSNERTIQLNVSSLKSGLYFIKMKNGTNEMIKKLIID